MEMGFPMKIGIPWESNENGTKSNAIVGI